VSRSISVVIPAWQEADTIEGAVRAALAVGDEVVVVDAGSPDGTADRARQAGAQVIVGPKGRGPQLHGGARAAAGDVLLFLHADARLPPEARGAILEALAAPGVVGGNFLLCFEPASPSARLLGWLNDARRRWLRIYYGDSAIFVRREVYERLGGFRAMPILEDYQFVRRLERLGPTAYIRRVTVTASARRFQGALFRTLVVWIVVQGLYSMGMSAERLAGLYRDIRGATST